MQIWVMTQLQNPVLSVQLLGEIADFERYEGVVWTPQSVCMKFYVRYNNNRKGYVYSCHYIRGKASSKLNLLNLHYKLGVAKSLVGENEWRYIRGKYSIERDQYLILSRDMNL